MKTRLNLRYRAVSAEFQVRRFTMKVLLKEDVDHLGYAGDIKKVAAGYGRNYLIPRGLAVMATTTAMKQAEAWRTRAQARREELRAEYDALQERIAAVSLEFTTRAGSNGRLYGSITSSQLMEALNAELGTTIDRRKLEMEPLRDLGAHVVSVRLDADHQPEFNVLIKSTDGVWETAQEAAAVAAAEDAAGEDGELAAAMEEAAAPDEEAESPDSDVAAAVEEAFSAEVDEA